MPRSNQQLKLKQTKSRCSNYTTAHKETRKNLLQKFNEMDDKIQPQKTKQYQTPHICLQTDSEDEVTYHKKKHQYGGRYKYSTQANKKKIRRRISQAIRPLKLTQAQIMKIQATKNKGKMHSRMKLKPSNTKPSLTIGDEAKWAIQNYFCLEKTKKSMGKKILTKK